MTQDFITTKIQDSISVKVALAADEALMKLIETASEKITGCFQNDGKVLFCGNGGSAADAQHLAAEFSGRFYIDREPLYAEALHVNSSYITAVANDYSYDDIYARLIKAKARKGDVLVGISTSGNSENIIRAFKEAKKKDVFTIALTGQSGGKMKSEVDILINVPSSDTPRIQESHILIGHIICEIVENAIFKTKND
ncbi:phosphoheptose isomerase [Mucilaginibacter pineti]|uniref:Phosphoheptose isomerase n=1 Tax=Mucilaginibacter pineti TaxID=1391627 RepID=A0A1G6ZEZ6_9SPHI|nr:SIS domain-containing protein [Mucilaginibacter pineti]SDE01214.1 phosphoheptose isomerase [Mucilaginibacter pineti]